MNTNKIQRIMMLLTLLMGGMSAMSVPSTANTFSINALSISPGQTTNLEFTLSNATEFYGFQMDIQLPTGLEFVKGSDGKADVTLSSTRVSDYQLVTNLVDTRNLKLGAFSKNHTAISGSTGKLFTAKIKAASSFTGGTINVNNIRFTNSDDQDFDLESATATATKVDAKVTNITLSNTTLDIKVGKTANLTVTSVTPEYAANKNVTWSSNKTSVATVSSTGEVTGISAGQAIITATAADGSGVTVACTVNVSAIPVTSITLSPSPCEIIIGGKATVTATVSPTDATNKKLNWTSNNTSVASVSNTGEVTAVSVGSATITATAADGSGVKATCSVTVNPILVSSISLPATQTCTIGQGFKLSPTIAPENATDKSVTWSSSDANIATVDKDGNVNPLKVGEATITVTANDASKKSASCRVTVNKLAVEKVTVSPEALSINVGSNGKLTATISPSTATNKTVTWTSSDTGIATVASDGTVTGIKAGNVTITATADGKSATAAVTVSKAPDGLVATLSETQIKQGETTTLAVSLNGAENFSYSALQFTVTLPEGVTIESSVFNSEFPSSCTTNSNTSGFTSKYIIFTSAAESVKLSSDLVILTIKADDIMPLGNVDINISNIKLSSSISGNTTLPDKTYTIEILRKFIPVETMNLSAPSLEIQKGSDAVLTATISPTDATNQEIEWIVGDKNKVSLTASGNKVTIKALELGETTITARTKDGSNVSATATIKVIPVPAKSITLDGTSVTILKERETNQLSATVSPAETTYPDVEWSSSDTKVATVDENGLVTAVAKGTAVITAKVTATPTVTASYSLTVEALLLGDSNEDRDVDVFDVVNIANYIVGKNPTPFCFVASDVIWDKTINVADQNAAINLALGLPIGDAAKAPSRTSAANSGRLNAGTVSATADGSIIVPLSISSEIAYSSLQANVILPEGMEVRTVRTTAASASFSVMHHIADDGVLRTVIYSLDNSPLPAGGQAILEIVIDANGAEGTMLFDNVLAATPGCALYSLDADACEINVPTGADSLVSDSLIVRPVDGAIEVLNAKGMDATILDIQGRVINNFKAQSNAERFDISAGLYIVKIGNQAFKVNVK